MDLSKYVVTENHNHLSVGGFSKLANCDTIGAIDNTTSYDKRRQIDQNRQLVKRYQHSMLGSSYGELRAQSVVKDAKINRAFGQRSLPRNNPNVRPVPVIRFHEPESRSYNPFG